MKKRKSRKKLLMRPKNRNKKMKPNKINKRKKRRLQNLTKSKNKLKYRNKCQFLSLSQKNKPKKKRRKRKVASTCCSRDFSNSSEPKRLHWTQYFQDTSPNWWQSSSTESKSFWFHTFSLKIQMWLNAFCTTFNRNQSQKSWTNSWVSKTTNSRDNSVLRLKPSNTMFFNS